MRVKGGNVSRKRHKKVLEQASGFRGSLHKLFRRGKKVSDFYDSVAAPAGVD